MANAIKDQNRVKVKLGVLFSDGETLIPIALDDSNFGLKTNTSDTVSSSILNDYIAGKPIPRDENHEPAWCGVSDDDADVVLPIFVDANGAVLIDN